MTEEKSQSLNDVGTRREHLMDLYDLWAFALEILNGPLLLQDKSQDTRRSELESAMRLLFAALEKDYNEGVYSRAINYENKAEKIEGGRGTPLKKEEHPEGYDKPSD